MSVFFSLSCNRNMTAQSAVVVCQLEKEELLSKNSRKQTYTLHTQTHTHTCPTHVLLPGSLCVLTIRAQRVQLLLYLRLIWGASVLWQEAHQAVLWQGHQIVTALGWGGGSSSWGLELQRAHSAVLHWLGQDLLNGLVVGPVWCLSTLTSCSFQSPGRV